ncbi:serine-type endopeptidase [Aureococcus anophagefferens]|nr:serine-type endopeptidase [Aureococcus anophagefferens]
MRCSSCAKEFAASPADDDEPAVPPLEPQVDDSFVVVLDALDGSGDDPFTNTLGPRPGDANDSHAGVSESIGASALRRRWRRRRRGLRPLRGGATALLDDHAASAHARAALYAMTKRLLLALAACAGPRAAAASCSVEECEYQYDGMCGVDAGYCACDPHDCSSVGSIPAARPTTASASHPDLAKLSVADSCDHYLNAAATDSHGTHCAALAVGSSNDHCGVGVAYGASLASCRTLGESDVHDNPTAFAKGDVNSNSWGEDSCIVESDYDYYYYYYYDARRLEDACPFSSDVYDTPCADQGSKESEIPNFKAYLGRFPLIDAAGQDALKAGVADGRGGKGIVYVFAAGNEYTGNGNTNFEGYLNPATS